MNLSENEKNFIKELAKLLTITDDITNFQITNYITIDVGFRNFTICSSYTKNILIIDFKTENFFCRSPTYVK